MASARFVSPGVSVAGGASAVDAAPPHVGPLPVVKKPKLLKRRRRCGRRTGCSWPSHLPDEEVARNAPRLGYYGEVTRLERFRQFVSAMDPTEPLSPKTAEHYVHYAHRDSIVEAICAPLELTPSRRFMLVGSTGSGKTTLVRQCVARVREAVAQSGDQAIYFDVSRHHQLDTEGPRGILIALAGAHLIHRGKDKEKSKEVVGAMSAIEAPARGYGEWVEQEDQYDAYDDSDQEPRDSDDESRSTRVTSDIRARCDHRNSRSCPKSTRA